MVWAVRGTAVGRGLYAAAAPHLAGLEPLADDLEHVARAGHDGRDRVERDAARGRVGRAPKERLELLLLGQRGEALVAAQRMQFLLWRGG